MAQRSWSIEWIDEIASTNTTLAERARAGAADGSVLIARSQTAGKGRLGRVWLAPPDSALLCSVLVRPRLAVERCHLTSLAMAVAAVDLLTGPTSGAVAAKWPNDVIVPEQDDRKLAGILAELVLEPGHGPAVVVGIGMNLRRPDQPPADVADRAIWLDDLGVRRTPQEIAPALLAHFDARLHQLEDEPEQFLDAYRRCCVTIGSSVRATRATDVIEGTAIDIGPDGQLVIEHRSDAAGVSDPKRRMRTSVTTADVVRLRPSPD